MSRAGLRTALAALLACAVPCAARGDAPARPPEPPPAAHAPAPGSERIELHVTFPPWQYTGSFRVVSADGRLFDEGVARDRGGFTAGDGTVRRVLEGARGTLVLRVVSGGRPPGLPSIFGRWRIVSGTGTWSNVAGEGTFTSSSRGELKGGSPFELQTLVGRIVRG